MVTVGGELGPCGTKTEAPPSMVSAVQCRKFANAVYIAASESEGLSLVPKSPGNKVGNSIGFAERYEPVSIQLPYFWRYR